MVSFNAITEDAVLDLQAIASQIPEFYTIEGPQTHIHILDEKGHDVAAIEVRDLIQYLIHTSK